MKGNVILKGSIVVKQIKKKKKMNKGEGRGDIFSLDNDILLF